MRKKLNKDGDELSKVAAPKATPIIKIVSPIKIPNEAHAPARHPYTEANANTYREFGPGNKTVKMTPTRYVGKSTMTALECEINQFIT
jgi:hypothetical protein